MTRSRELAKILTDGNLTGTLDVAGIATANAGVKVDNITIDGTEIDLSSGDLTLDVAGTIILNADSGSINLADASTTFGELINSSSDLIIKSSQSDKDIIFKGVDGGALITALTLDMSAAGAATFNSNITAEGGDYLLRNSSGSSILSIISGTSGSSIIKLGDTADFDIGQIEYNHGSNYLAIKTNDSERIRINASGNVGIGTSSPSYPLTVASASSSVGLAINGRSSDNLGALYFFANNGSTQYGNILTSASEFRVTSTPASAVQTFFTNSAERMRLTSNGLLGLSTSTPAEILSINGNMRFQTGMNPVRLQYFNSGGTYAVGSSGGASISFHDVSGSQEISFETHHTGNSHAERMRIDKSGKVGIGTTSPDWPLQVSGTNTQIGIESTTSNQNASLYYTANGANQWEVVVNITAGLDYEIYDRVNNATRFVVNHNGNVSIGNNGDSYKLDVDGGSAETRIRVSTTGTDRKEAGIIFANSSKSAFNDGSIIAHGGGYLDFMDLANNIIMSLNMSGGDLTFGLASINHLAGFGATPAGGRVEIQTNYPNYNALRIKNNHSGDNGVIIGFLNNAGSACGSISQTNATTVAYNTSSDYRLKENLNYDWDATSLLKQLKPTKFNWISDENNTEIMGFIAHEVSDVVPQAIEGVKDGTRELGVIKNEFGQVVNEETLEINKEAGQTWEKTKDEDVYQNIDHSKLVPLLTKALQEANTKITTLEARITTLENA